jgi:hypothetical protein
LIFIYKVFSEFVIQAGRCFVDTYKEKKNPHREVLVKYKEKKKQVLL